MKLVVTHAFAPYRTGAEITDPAEMAAALASHPSHVVRVASVDAPAAPAPVAEPQKD